MKKYIVIVIVQVGLVLSANAGNAKNYSEPFEDYNFQETDIPLPSSKMQKENDIFFDPFANNSRLKSDEDDCTALGGSWDDDTGCEFTGMTDNGCQYVDGCTVGNGFWFLLAMIAIYGTLLTIKARKEKSIKLIDKKAA